MAKKATSKSDKEAKQKRSRKKPSQGRRQKASKPKKKFAKAALEYRLESLTRGGCGDRVCWGVLRQFGEAKI